MSRIFIDVRESFEFKMGHVDGANNIPLSKLKNSAEKLEGIPKDAEIILYCLSGGRSDIAMKSMENMGYTNIVNGINKKYIEEKYST